MKLNYNISGHRKQGTPCQPDLDSDIPYRNARLLLIGFYNCELVDDVNKYIHICALIWRALNFYKVQYFALSPNEVQLS